MKFCSGRLSLIILFLLLTFCSREKDPNLEMKETILARIGDKTISVNEFIRRAEHTVRPPYCRGGHNLQKKIVLNSLIAEKLFTLEATEQNDFISSENIKAYLTGREEQAMRQWLFYKEAHEKVVLDTSKIIKIVKLAGRKYNISYFSLEDSVLATEISKEIYAKNNSFEDVFFKNTGLDSLPKREVEWSSSENNSILDALYSETLQKNQILGPVKIVDSKQFVLMKINGWIDRPTITESQFHDRWKNVSDEYTQREALRIKNNYIRKIMKGKSIEFSPDTFRKIANLLGPIYLMTDSEKKEFTKNSYWKLNNENEKLVNLEAQIKALYQEPLFKVDNEIWTVKRFSEELRVHPLVFRNKKMKNREFGQQLQFAIIDMITDKYLTKEAYKRGYDKINVIQRNKNMWKDNLNYQYYKAIVFKKFEIDSVSESNYLTLIENHLNVYVDSLQNKYSDIIQINTEAFDKIKLTRIDMTVTQQNMPFSKTVPGFPLITTDHRLDYGRKMVTQNIN